MRENGEVREGEENEATDLYTVTAGSLARRIEDVNGGQTLPQGSSSTVCNSSGN